MKKTIIALSIIPALACALTAEQKEAFNQANLHVLEKQGLPTPNGGALQVVPSETMGIKGWKKKKFAAAAAEMKKNGYVKESSDRAYELLHIKEKIQKSAQLEKNMFKANESHLRHNAEDLRFAYTYVGVPQNAYTKFLGIAPVGTYSKEGPMTGWTGAVSFFETSFGNCAYTEKNMVAAHGAARIAEEEATSEVNGKVTLIDVIGNDSTGYLYHVNWFDNVFNRSVECATKEYSNNFTKEAIELAKKIDSNA